MNIISLFTGCGGLDLGFTKAGFNVIWANDFDKNVRETYDLNHKGLNITIKNITKVSSDEIPNDFIGLIGGPPCQSWSAAGKGEGLADPRGKLFLEYIRILEDKQPHFFLAENVKGMLNEKHSESLNKILRLLDNAGYSVTLNLMNSADYEVPQNRHRIIIVGYRKDLGITFKPPKKIKQKITVRQSLCYPPLGSPICSIKNLSQQNKWNFPNHEYFTGSYSYIFMSRNRVLNWDSQSYTIQASGRQASLHPQAPKMKKIKKDIMEFVKGKKRLYRRLSIRECARIQTFPDGFIFIYDHLDKGYKMIGNAVPVKMAEHIALKIKKDLGSIEKKRKEKKLHKRNSTIKSIPSEV